VRKIITTHPSLPDLSHNSYRQRIMSREHNPEQEYDVINPFKIQRYSSRLNLPKTELG